MRGKIVHGKNIFYVLPVLLCCSYNAIAQTPVNNKYPGAPTVTVNTVPAAYNGSIPLSYVRAWEAKKVFTTEAAIISTSRVNNEVSKITQYFDGLGRPLQTVGWQASPNGNDMVSALIYDEYSREIYKYLPYTDNASTNGKFKYDPFAKQNSFLASYYNPDNNANGEQVFYAVNTFEPSQLNRPVKSNPQGNNWAGNNKGDSIAYTFNDAADSVRIWKISLDVLGAAPTSTAYYGAGQLAETILIDIRGYQTVEYKDKNGRVILKKVQVATGGSLYADHRGWLCTYYVYDDLDNLRFVMQPKGTDWLRTNGWSFGTTLWKNSAPAKELCFSYDYDVKKRMIIKRVPGAGEVLMVYDARDRLVMTQDSLLRASSQWMYTDYDSLNRLVLTGLWNNTTDRATHQNSAGSSITYPTPASGYTILSQTYYDDYSWVSGSGSGLSSSMITTYNSNTTYFYTADNNTFPYPQSLTATSLTRGMVTGTKTNVVGSSSYLYAVSFYDDRARVIETQSTNNTGSKDTAITQYSFSGQALRMLACHGKGGTNAQYYKVLSKMTYDANGRVTQVNKKVGNSTEVIVAKNAYDELGQLAKKELGQKRNNSSQNSYTSNPVDTLRYTYNVRGWLRGINRDYARADNNAVNWFGEELCYDFGFTSAELNGNIAGMRWKSAGDGEQRAYGFTYDLANRLTKAFFTQKAGSVWDVTAGIDYSVNSITYDLNGNILTLNQKGAKLSSSTLIDSLLYNYVTNTNKLNYVTDKVNDTSAHLGDFTEINNNTTQDYWYDGNGNLTKDNNKNISSITYNYLNLPSLITVTGKGTITYIYDAAGNKLKKTTVDNTVNPSKTTVTDYLGLFTYQNDTLQFIAQDEGRARPKTPTKSDTMYYDYFEKDHLGNIRTVLTDQLQTDAYPTLNFEGTAGTQEVINQDAVWDNGSGQSIGVIASREYYSNTYVKKVKKGTGAIGAAKLLKVMSGDTLNVAIDYYYTNANNDNTSANGVTTLVNSIAAVLAASTNTSGVVKAGASGISTALGTNSDVAGFLTNETASSDSINKPPMAFLHVLMFDERFVFDRPSSYVKQVAYTPGDPKNITIAGLPVVKNGYAYIYFSNESNSIVRFDNFMLTHIRGPLVQENAYSPEGLGLQMISGNALSFGDAGSQRKQFNGIEHTTDLDLNQYDAFFRTMDPQVGRWWQIDPKPTFDISSYSAFLNNSIKYSDPLGDTTWLYNKNGHYLGLVPDKMNNEIHFLDTKGDKSSEITTEGLNSKQIKSLAQAFRSASIAFIGANSINDLKGILNSKDNKGLETLFVASLAGSKEIRFSQVDVSNSERGVDHIDNPEKWVEKQLGSALESLFGVGHSHPMEALTENEKKTGFKVVGIETDKKLQRFLGSPSYPKDYVNQADLKRTFDNRTPFFIATPVGITVYTAGETPKAQQYYTFKQLH